MKHVAIVSAAVLGLAGGAVLLVAGPLNPPAGAVSSTYKTLTEVEPRIAISSTNTPGDTDSVFKITQPGSYYLTGNITGVSGKYGIEIAASGVTIDLSGFALTGVAGSLDGIGSSTSIQNIVILNGSASNWGDKGIDLSAAGAINIRVEGVASTSNTGDGIAIGGRCLVKNCVLYLNGGNGLLVGTEAVIEDCLARSNTLDGIVLSAVGVISRCTIRSNIGNGIRSVANGYMSISDCVVVENSLDGIKVNAGALVTRNNCAFNGLGGTGTGIHVLGSDCRIEANMCLNSDVGIQVDGTGNIIVKNTCSGNTTNWSVVGGNVILVVNATTAGAVSGNSGGTAPGSTDPNANFSY
ncbi:MAG: right-handed parallel beta-helix repeat-containing protein [Phycisphaerales bacterium]